MSGLFLTFFVIFLLLPTGSGSAVDPQALLQGNPLLTYEGFPEGWEIRGDRERAREVYQVVEKDGAQWLSIKVTGKPIRIFKKVRWDPSRNPILTWRWRVHQWSKSPKASIQFYVSLDRDLMGIPVIEKYIWSRSLPEGTVLEGGFFSPTQIVIRSGLDRPGEWITERVDVLEMYRRIHGGNPSKEPVGIGLRVSQGVEMEISEVRTLPAP